MTPNLAAWARKSATFTAYSPIPYTMKSLYSVLCGVPAYPTMDWPEYDSSNPFLRFCLPHLLKESGESVETALFTTAHAGYHKILGFDKVIDGTDMVAAEPGLKGFEWGVPDEGML